MVNKRPGAAGTRRARRADGLLKPAKKDQAPPGLRYFKRSPK